MIEFVFASLGSITFWVLYFVLSLFCTTITLKLVAEDTFKYITSKEKSTKYWSGDVLNYTALTALHFVFWPFIMLGIVGYLTFCRVIGPSFCESISAINKIIPTIKFDNKTTTEEHIEEEYEKNIIPLAQTLGELKEEVDGMLTKYLFFGIRVPTGLLVAFTKTLNDTGLFHRVTKNRQDYYVVTVSSEKEGLDLYDNMI